MMSGALPPANLSRSCESLTQTIRKLHDQAGIEAAGATATRRTFGVRLKRDGYDLSHIREVLGLATLSAAKALCEGDPVDLGLRRQGHLVLFDRFRDAEHNLA